MKKIILIAAILILAGTGIYYFKTKNAEAAAKYAETEVMNRNMSDIIDTTGEVEPLNRVEITPSSGGRVEKILVKEGDKISIGQTLALMSSDDRVAVMDAARSLTKDEYEYWQNAYKPIKIISPLNGTIILKNVVEGQTVNAKAALFAVSDKLIIDANVDESDIGRVRKGQRTEIILDAYPENIIKGRVFQILAEGKNVSNVITYKVRIMPRNMPSSFKSQMTANIKIYLSRKKSIKTIPSVCVAVDKDGDAAAITGFKNKEPIYTKIKTGNEFDGKTEVISGLKLGDRVWYREKEYIPQRSSAGKNPFMPKRPGRKARKAVKSGKSKR